MLSPTKRVELAIAEFKKGKMIIVTDDPGRENEGDLIIPAELITPAHMNFMIRHGSGIVCISMSETLLDKMQLPLMVPADKNNSVAGTPFTVSVDAKVGISTGVSATDRVKTVQAIIADNATADDLVMPGHMFPLRAKPDGVFVRQGHTEGSVDLANIGGYKSAAVICEIMDTDGEMLRGEALSAFAKEHDLLMITIDDIITYRLANEYMIDEEVSTKIKLQQYGEFDLTVVREKITGHEHIILEKPSVNLDTSTLLRIHSSCATGDIFTSQHCDCHKQLHHSLTKISEQGGMLIYLKQEGRGIGLLNKIKSYALQSEGFDTVQANEELGLPADARKYFIAANILHHKKIHSVRLLTNNPTKMTDLIKYGIQDVQREAMPIFANVYNKKYLNTKREKLNHLFTEDCLNLQEIL